MATTKKDTDPGQTTGTTSPAFWAVTWDEDGEPGSGLPTNLWATLLDINWSIWTYPKGENIMGKYLLALETTWLADDRTLGINHDGLFDNQESCGKLMNHLPSYDGVTPAELTGFKDMDQLRQFVKQLADGATQQDGSPLLPEGTAIKAGQLIYIGEKVPTEKKHVLPNPDTKGAQQKRSFITAMKDNQIALPADARDIHYFRGLRAYLVRMPHVTSLGLPGYGSKNRKDGRESEVLCVTQIDPASVANLGKHMAAPLTADGSAKPNGSTGAGVGAGTTQGAAPQAGAAASNAEGVKPDLQGYVDKFLDVVTTALGDNEKVDFATVRSTSITGYIGSDKAKANAAINKLKENPTWWSENGLTLSADKNTITFAE